MSYQFKPVQSQVAYRISNISFVEDGGISAAIVVGTITKQEGSEESTFTQIASQGYYIAKDEVDTLMLDSVNGNIREVVEASIEYHLRAKGTLTI